MSETDHYRQDNEYRTAMKKTANIPCQTASIPDATVFFGCKKSTFIGYFMLVLLALAGVMNQQGAHGADLPPPQSSSTGPGDVTGPQPIPEGVTDLSFLPTIDDGSITAAKTPSQVASVLQIVALLTLITLAPGIMMVSTCFLRIMIVLSFLRKAIGTQSMPPDKVLVGIAFVLSVFIMAPTWEKSWNEGMKPYFDDAVDPATGQRMTQSEMFSRALSPVREFMFSCLTANEGEEEVRFFMGVSGHQVKDKDGGVYWLGENNRRVEEFTELQLADIPTFALVPAFVTSEMKRAFWMGFLLYLPFLILDMVIASVLMSMGMMMLPPAMVSMPFKLILFILVDGWRLLMEALVTSFPPDMLAFINVIS